MKLKNVLMSVFFIALTMSATTAKAQLKFGVRAEVGINKPSLKKSDYKVENMNAFKIGPTAEFTLPIIGLAIDGSLLYSNENMNIKKIKEDAKIMTQDVKSHYLDVPVNLKYKIGIIGLLKGYLAAGPYAQLKIAGDKIKLEDLQEQVKDNKFQAGINLGFGAEVINRVQVGFNYRIKLTDDYSINKPMIWKDLLNHNKGFWSLTASVYL